MANRWIVELEEPTGRYSREELEQLLRKMFGTLLAGNVPPSGEQLPLRLISVKEVTLPPPEGAGQ